MIRGFFNTGSQQMVYHVMAEETLSTTGVPYASTAPVPSIIMVAGRTRCSYCNRTVLIEQLECPGCGAPMP